MPSITLKTIRDQRRSLALWAVSILGLLATYGAMWPTVRDNTSYADLIKQMPESMRSLFIAGAAGDLSTPQGFLYVELLSFMAPMLVLVYTIGAGASAVAGEEERRTLDLLLSTPVTRTRVVLEKFAAMVVGTAVLGLAFWASLVIVGVAANMSVGAGMAAATVVHLGMLGLVFGSLALALGAITGRVGVARAVPVALAVLSYLVNALAEMVGWLARVRPVSPFYQYAGHDPIRHGLYWPSLTVAALTCAVLVALAVAGLRRRDVSG